MIGARGIGALGARRPAATTVPAVLAEPGMAPVLYLHHPSSLEHDTGNHPERAARIEAIEAQLRDWPGLERVVAPAATVEQLHAVHSPDHVVAIRELAESGGGMIDGDTTTSAGSYRAALHSAGAATHMVDRLLAGDPGGPRAGFCATRPPGHHAETATAMGFCLFNNVAVAARHARDAHGIERLLILDWDVHHGNGTQEILWEDPGVLFVSIHQWPLYPGTGAASETGAGAGAGHTVNLPVPPGSGDETFVSLVEHVVAPLAGAYRPQLVLVSAGFDAHREDPLAECSVSDQGYAAMAAAVGRMAAAEGDVPIGVVLEGGYAIGALARSVAATLRALGDPSPAPPPELAVSPLAQPALERAVGFWPGLGSGSS
jgi:acetoin utilization deacetylase AcuC-like enzyme